MDKKQHIISNAIEYLVNAMSFETEEQLLEDIRNALGTDDIFFDKNKGYYFLDKDAVSKKTKLIEELKSMPKEVSACHMTASELTYDDLKEDWDSFEEEVLEDFVKVAKAYLED